VGGSLWGIAGMLFAVPVCSILHALLRLGVHRRLEAQAAAGASVPAPTPEEKM
jgi:predicted PurR-regulated permease PerM